MTLEQPVENKGEDQENIDINKLNFEQLQRILELGKKSLTRTEEGFVNIDGEEIQIKKIGREYNLTNFSYILELEHYMATHNDSILNGSKDKDAVMRELEKVIEELGYRIIE